MKNKSAELILREFGGVPDITPDAHELKEKALGTAATVLQVTTEAEQTVAVQALRSLREITRGVETSRKAIKAPVLDLGRKIDNIAADFMTDIVKAENRLTGYINHFQRKQLELQRATEKEATAELNQVDQLREEAIGLRLAGNPEAAAKIEEKVTDIELGAELSGPQTLANPAPKGLVVRKRVSFQILDPIVFVQAYPQFWRATKNGDHDNEILKLDRMAILDELNREDGKGIFHRSKFPEELAVNEGEHVKPPGMRVFEDLKAHVR